MNCVLKRYYFNCLAACPIDTIIFWACRLFPYGINRLLIDHRSDLRASQFQKKELGQVDVAEPENEKDPLQPQQHIRYYSGVTQLLESGPHEICLLPTLLYFTKTRD